MMAVATTIALSRAAAVARRRCRRGALGSPSPSGIIDEPDERTADISNLRILVRVGRSEQTQVVGEIQNDLKPDKSYDRHVPVPRATRRG